MQKVTKKVMSLILSLMILMPCIGVGFVPGFAADLDRTALDKVIADAKAVNAEEYVDVSALNEVVKNAQNTEFKTQVSIDDKTAEIAIELLKLEKKNTAAKVTGIAGSNIEGWSNVQLGGINATSAKSASDSNMTNADTVHSYEGSWHWGHVFGTTFDTVFKNAYAQYSIDRYTTTKLDDLGNIASWMVAIVANGGHDHVFRLVGTEKSGGSGTEQDAVSIGSKGTKINFRTNFSSLFSCGQGGMHGHTSPAYIPTAYTPIKGDVPAAGESVQVMSYSQSNVPTNQNGLVYGHCIRFGFQFDAYDTTALRAAIAQTIYAKSSYSVDSYNTYLSALTEAMNVLNTPVTVKVNGDEEANYENIAEAQTAIDNATKKLNDAYNALDKDFNIEYYSDGVLFETQTVLYADNESTLITSVPTKYGYVFTNTWKGADGTDYTLDTVAHRFATKDGSAVRLDANYREAKYTVNYDLNGGILDVDSAQYDYNTKFNLPDTPTKTGYTFAGWKLGENTYAAGAEASQLSGTDGATVRLTAQWTENKYTIHFDSNGGDQTYNNVELEYTKEYVVPAAPTKAGFTFTGWLGSNGKVYAAAEKVSKLASDNGAIVTLTAQWDTVIYNVSLEKEPVNYTVTGLDSTIVAVYGTSNFKVTIDPAYTQNELIVNADNATVTPLGDGNYQISNATGNVVIKVNDITKKNTYTVKFNDGENDIATYTPVEHGTKVTVPDMPISKVIEKDGVRVEYFFTGWLVNGEKVDDAANYAITADTTFIAQYSAEEYVWVTFMSQDGSTQLLRKAFKKGDAAYYGLAAPTKDADAQYTYSFVGWNTTANSEEAIYGVAAPIPTTSAITVYAAFSKTLRNYEVTVPTGEGFKVAVIGGLDISAVPYGTTVTFTVTVDRAYNESVPAVKLNGTLIEAKTISNSVYTFEFVLTGASNITVDANSVKKNVYSASLPIGTGFTASVAEGYDAANITDGDSFAFTIALDTAYSKSELVVKYNGKVLTAVNGVYTIENVTANINNITVEGVKVNTYTVKFVDGDGNVIQTSTVEYGKLASYDGATPTKTPTEAISYKFIGWDKDLTTVTITEDTTFTAQFEEQEALILTVKFVDGNGNVLKTYTTYYGGSVVYDGEIPTKAADEKGHFEFTGWDKGYANVTANMTVNAKFVQKNHNPKEVRLEATCGVNGYIRMVCDDCGYVINETVLQATGHHYGEWKTTVQPTHTTTGRQERVCTVCGDVALETLNRLPEHEYVGTVKVEATCTEDGLMVYKCVCGDSYEEVIAKLGHSCDEWTITKEATCTGAGAKTSTCARCSEVIEEVIPAKGHNVSEYTDNGDGTSTGTCSECGEKVTIKNSEDPSKPDKPTTNWFTKIINWFKKIFKIIKGWFTKKTSVEIYTVVK